MTSKEKARDLYDKFYGNSYVPWMGGEIEMPTEEAAKESAIVCCDEIIAVIRPIMLTGEKLEYWNEVKEEINKL